MSQGKFYPSMSVLNQTTNMVPSFNGMNVLSNVYQNLAMKNALLSQQTRQGQSQMPQPASLLSNTLTSQNDILLNGGNGQNSSLDYFNLLMSQSGAGQMTNFGSGQNQSQLNQLYMQLLNQNCPQMYQTPTPTTGSNNDAGLYGKASFLANNNVQSQSTLTANSFGNPLLDNSLMQFNLTGPQGTSTTTTYQNGATTELV